MQVAARAEYAELVARAGFVDIVEVDLTKEYAVTQQAWYEAYEQRAPEIHQLVSDAEFAEGQTDRRETLDAIGAGLLRRSLFTAVRP